MQYKSLGSKGGQNISATVAVNFLILDHLSTTSSTTTATTTTTTTAPRTTTRASSTALKDVEKLLLAKLQHHEILVRHVCCNYRSLVGRTTLVRMTKDLRITHLSLRVARHSAEIALALLTQQSWIQILTLPKYFFRQCVFERCAPRNIGDT